MYLYEVRMFNSCHCEIDNGFVRAWDDIDAKEKFKEDKIVYEDDYFIVEEWKDKTDEIVERDELLRMHEARGGDKVQMLQLIYTFANGRRARVLVEVEMDEEENSWYWMNEALRQIENRDYVKRTTYSYEDVTIY